MLAGSRPLSESQRLARCMRAMLSGPPDTASAAEGYAFQGSKCA